MNNQEYWELRRAREMYRHMDEAEKLAEELDIAYRKAALYLQKEAEKIFNKYQDKYNLTRAQAEVLLKGSKVPENIEELKRLLKKDKERYKELLQELETPAYKARIDNLANVYGQLNSIVLPMIANERRKHIALYERLAEEAFYQTIFDLQQYSGYGFNFKALDKKTIQKVLDTRWSGKNFSQAIWDNTHALAESVKREILINLLTGRPLREAQQAIDDEFGKGYNKARRLVRTESAYVCNQIQRESYKACGIEKYIYVAILDLKTSLICRGLDKKVFLVSEAAVGVNYPPMHPWCRSTTIAYVSKDVLAKMKQSAIDPATGKRITVPGDMTYKEWYKKYVTDKGWTDKTIPTIASAESQYRDYLKLLHKKEVTLRKRQQKIYEAVKDRGSWAEFRNKQVDIKDLAALTAYTGDEFALFTGDRGKIVVHGRPKRWDIPNDAWEIIKNNQYEWTAHSHPTFRNLRCSPEDIRTLNTFTWQRESVIIDLTGKTVVFTASEQDWFNQYLGVKR